MIYEQDNHSLSNDKEGKIVWRNSMMRIAKQSYLRFKRRIALREFAKKCY